jgi:hypothetical protein
MMTQTTLSVVTPASGRIRASNSSFESPASSLQNLIANLELEFELSHRKESPLKISNRKYFAIFSFAPSAGLCVGLNTLSGTTTRSSTFLIYGSAIRIAHKCPQTRHLQISNRQRNRAFSVCRTTCFSRCTSHSRDMIPALVTPLQ